MPAVLPGNYNIVLRATAQVPFNKDPMAKQKPNVQRGAGGRAGDAERRSQDPGHADHPGRNPTVKVGRPGRDGGQVARQFDYTGEFKIEVVLPPTVKGVTVDPAVIPAGKDEVKLIVKVAADAMPGNRPDLIVRATALYQWHVPTASPDVPLTVNVVK